MIGRPTVLPRYNLVMYIRVNQRDNVGIIVDPEGAAGDTGEWIPQSHKIALGQLEAGQPVLRYGQTIGFANRTIAAGSWVREEMIDMPAPPPLDRLRSLLFRTARSRATGIPMAPREPATSSESPPRFSVSRLPSSTPCGVSKPNCCRAFPMWTMSSPSPPPRAAGGPPRPRAPPSPPAR